MRASRSLRHLFLGLVVLFLSACGSGDSGTDTNKPPPVASVRVPTTLPATAVALLDGTGSSANGGGTLTYSWVLTSKPAGSAASIDNPTVVQPTLTTDLLGTYSVTLTVNDGNRSTSASASMTTTAFTPPSIVADIVEPVSGTVQLSLFTNPGTTAITWTVDATPLATAGVTVPWDTTTVSNGNHVVVARATFGSSYYYDVRRTFQVAQSTVSFNGPTVSESLGRFTTITGAQSANGIVRVDATIDGATLGSLAVPNGCLDPTGAACASGQNGYSFAGTVGSGQHVIVITATDGIGNRLGTQIRFNVTDVP